MKEHIKVIGDANKGYKPISVERKKKLQEIFAKHNENNTPLEGNICKEEGCRGRVVRKVSSLFRGEFYFHTPKCKKCGREYYYAKNVHEVGVAKFIKEINSPVTI